MRILALCVQCRNQFDVSGHAPGEPLACRCGGTLTVPQPRAKAAVVSRCASCGGPRVAKGPACTFCGARFLEASGMGRELVCPGCFVCLPLESRFCVECGLQIAPQVLAPVQLDYGCPRCQAPLFVRHLQGPGSAVELFDCPSCGGLWIPERVFESIVVTKESLGTVRLLAGVAPGKPARELAPEAVVKYIPCPACKNLMNRRNFGQISGVIIDSCKGHGVWLDAKELNGIIRFVESGGMMRSRAQEQEREAEARKKAKGLVPKDALDLHILQSGRIPTSKDDVLWEVVKGVWRLFIQ